MKKSLFSILTLILALMLATGCSAIEDVNNSINYVDKATDYINKMSTFAKEVPPLIDKTTTDPNAVGELDQKLEEVNKEIDAFNKLTPPDFAKDVHNQVLQHNQELKSAIQVYTTNVKDGKLDPQILQNSDLVQQINALTKMLDQIQNLGN